MRFPLLLAFALILASASSGRPVAADDLERGEALFKLCAQCHGPEGAGDRDIWAPPIAGQPAWYIESSLHKFRDGIRGAHPDDLAGLRMRPMARTLRSDEDVKAVAAYVGSLQPTEPDPTLEGGDPARGKVLFTPCVACHGPDGAGNETLFAPTLKHTADWYMLSQLQKFKMGLRGANPADTSGMLMRPMSLTLVDEQAMKDVVAYIQSLK
jgi:cytochrome c553